MPDEKEVAKGSEVTEGRPEGLGAADGQDVSPEKKRKYEWGLGSPEFVEDKCP